MLEIYTGRKVSLVKNRKSKNPVSQQVPYRKAKAMLFPIHLIAGIRMILRDMRVFSATTSDARSNPALQTPTIRTPRPRYYGQLSLSLERALTFSLNLTRTPVNADNGHLFLAQSTELIS